MTKARELSELGSYLNVSGGIASVNNITVSSNLEINVVVANGSVGTAGQMLTSNGSGVYWLTPQIGDITNVIAGTGLTGGGSSGEVTVSLATSGVVANTYGNSSSIPVITVDTYGRLTNVSTTAVAGVTNFTYTGANNTFSISTGDGSTFTANITAANATLAGVVTVLDSVVNTSILIAASANSVKNAYDRAIDANTRAASAQTAAISAYSNATSYADSAAAAAYSNAVSVASTDATNKAANAYSNATSYAATIAGTAYSNAVSTAAADATSKANNAYTTAVAAAASDATNKAANAYSNAVSYAATVAGTAYSNAVSTAAADATSKANNAYTTAVAAAASDATSKANNAYTTAVSAASTDATNKAANAYSNATTFASNASNISSGTLAEPRLPYRMNQDVRTTDSVTFANGSFTGTVSVGGDLIVTGNVESTNVQSLAVSDPLIKLGVNNPADTSWGGFTFHYSGSGNTTNHAGLVRNPSTKEFLLMSTYGDEVNVDNNNSINVADPSFSYANLQLNTLTAQNATVSGNVGIGTTSPASKLHIQGSAPELRLYSDTTTGSTINFIDQSWQSQIVGSGGSIAFNAGGTTERMRIDSGGNVGIGTNSPTRNIHIQSGGTDPGILITTSGGANPSYIFLDSSDSNILDIENPNGIAFNGTGGAERMRITSVGDVGIGTTAPAGYGKLAVIGNIASSADGATVLTMRANAGATNLGSYNATGSYLAFQTNASGSGEVERMRITSAGDVGIGTSSPDGILHVRGNIIRLDKTGTAEPTIRFRSANDSYSSEWGVGHRSSSNDFAIRWFSGSAWSEVFGITTAGNIGIGTGSPAGKLAVVSSSSNGTTIFAWSSSHTIFGPNVGSTTGAALGLGYNTATDTAEIVSIAPSVAWKNLWISAVTTDLNTISGRVQTNQSFRAPIFYDSDNTAYYLNPESNSNLYSATFRTTILSNEGRANLDLDASVAALRIAYAGTGLYRHSLVTRHNSGANENNAWDFYVWRPEVASTAEATHRAFTIDGSAGTTSAIASRAPIFYDTDNTGYYFNSDAKVYTIYADNWFRSYGNTGWYNETYAGGWFMQDSTWVRIYNNKNVYTSAEIAAGGNITAYYSDERLKTKTGTISNAINKVQSLEGFTYVENELARSLGYKNKDQQVGVSAQQVQAVLPEAVSLAPIDYETLEDGTIVSKSGENYLTVDYSRLVPLLIEAIKEQQLTITEQSAKINTLEAKLDKIIQKLEG